MSSTKHIIYLFLSLCTKFNYIQFSMKEKEEYEKEDLKVKIIKGVEKYDKGYMIKLFGDKKVGKTCLLERITQNKFSSDYSKTYFKFFTIHAQINNEDTIIIRSYDHDGGIEEEKNVSLLSKASYCKSSNLLIIVYDISSKESFDNVNKYFAYCKNLGVMNPKYILVGNKTDLEDKRQVTYEEGKEFAAEHDMLFFETSAKNGTNVKEVFIKAVEILYKDQNYEKGETEEWEKMKIVNKKILQTGKIKKKNCCKYLLNICNCFQLC